MYLFAQLKVQLRQTNRSLADRESDTQWLGSAEWQSRTIFFGKSRIELRP
jgi:hypothetical protein